MQLSAIKQMELYSQQYPDVVSLSQGIPGKSSDTLIKFEVIQALMSNKVDKYSAPAGILELRELISRKLQDEGMIYKSDEIIVTVGATEAMTATLLSLTNPGEEVIIPTPTYSAFLRSAQTARLNIRQVPLIEELGWQLDVKALKESISNNTKAIILCNPNNPTGTVYDKKILLQIMKIVQENNMYLILDEVYRNMMYEDNAIYTICSIEEFKKNIIRIVSFSKDFSLTGWRVGFIHADQQIIERVLPIHDSLVNCAPVISQYAAMAALKYDKQIITEHLEGYRKHRKIVGKTLEHLSKYFSFSYPQGSYFFFPKLVRGIESPKFCYDLLEKERLALVPGSEFGDGGEGHVRICFGRDTDSVIEGMRRLKHYFQHYEK